MTLPLAFFRTRWADRFADDGDTCTIRRIASQTLSGTGTYAPTYTTVYTGVCTVRDGSGIGDHRPADYGEEQMETRKFTVLIPYTETGVQPDDEIVITSTHDARLNGLSVTVRSISADTYNTRRELLCEEAQGG